jgi:hypothetical protein
MQVIFTQQQRQIFIIWPFFIIVSSIGWMYIMCIRWCVYNYMYETSV